MVRTTSRRTFLHGIARAVGAVSIAKILTGCGSQGVPEPEPPPDPGNFRAKVDGSILDNTREYFTVNDNEDIVFDPEHGDWKVVRIRRNGQTLLEGGRLVFEVNGERREGANDSARQTQVRAGDMISWKLV